jgi:hypothetical protein
MFATVLAFRKSSALLIKTGIANDLPQNSLQEKNKGFHGLPRPTWAAGAALKTGCRPEFEPG